MKWMLKTSRIATRLRCHSEKGIFIDCGYRNHYESQVIHIASDIPTSHKEPSRGSCQGGYHPVVLTRCSRYLVNEDGGCAVIYPD